MFNDCCAFRRRAFRLCAGGIFVFFSSFAPVCAQTATAGEPAPAASPVPNRVEKVLVPGGTTVVVSLTEPISSATANVNDQVAIVVKKPVVVNGWIVVPAGANGHATVTQVTHAGSNGSGGKISMSVDWVYSSDGGMLALSTTNHASESGDTKGAASTATLLSWVLLGPVGFFAHNFVRGRDVTIGTDKTFTVFVDHDAHVRTNQRAGQGQEFDQ
ncbi:MAG TPA: hypothetical protein VHX17_02580 [Candidatus Cybelea sp.]|nr:hypothetical protein [Candidatus Cybelea sp.]